MIPNNIILTFRDDNIPKYIFSNIKRLNGDKNILFFTDNDIIKFLNTEYDSSYADFFNSIALGCIKADFFRYCYLFKHGGYYCDIDIEHTVPISSYISDNIEFFSVNSGACQNTTFQALLFCKPQHEILQNCIKDIMNPLSAEKSPFYCCTGDMYKNIKNYLSVDEVKSNDYIKKIESSYSIVRIGQEMPFNNRWICTYKNIIICFSRYETYQKTAPGTNKETGFFI